MDRELLKKYHVKFIEASEMNQSIYNHKLYIAYKTQSELKKFWCILAIDNRERVHEVGRYDTLLSTADLFGNTLDYREVVKKPSINQYYKLIEGVLK